MSANPRAPLHDDIPPMPKHPCPFCGSDATVATGRKISASSYWRCEGCGEMWHPDRIRGAAPTRRNDRWR